MLRLNGRRELVPEIAAETSAPEPRGRKVHRTIRLTAPVIEREVQAAYQHGILVNHLRRVAPAVANRIVIK